MDNPTSKENLLYVTEMDGRHVYDVKTIIRVEAKSNYSLIYLKNRRNVLVVCKVLRWVQSQLPNEMFVRVHRSHLVNKAYISQAETPQTDLLQLVTGERVPVSRRRRVALRQHRD